MNRFLIEAIVAAVAAGSLAIAWVAHNHAEQEIGRQQCQRAVEAAYNKAVKAAAAKYDGQVKELSNAVQQYQADRDRANLAWQHAQQQLHDYADQLRAASTGKSTATAGGDQDAGKVVTFGLTDYLKFADTCAAVAKDGEDDARELELCQKFAETVSPTAPAKPGAAVSPRSVAQADDAQFLCRADAASMAGSP
jgi:hypothetical protein